MAQTSPGTFWGGKNLKKESMSLSTPIRSSAMEGMRTVIAFPSAHSASKPASKEIGPVTRTFGSTPGRKRNRANSALSSNGSQDSRLICWTRTAPEFQLRLLLIGRFLLGKTLKP